MHGKLLFPIHARHHSVIVPDSGTFLMFSVWERAGHGLISIGTATLVSRWHPLPLEGRVAYALIFLLGDLIGHLNVELMPAGFSRSVLGKLFFTPTYHALHHLRFKGHYGLYSPVMDVLFGTYFDDYPDLQARAAQGHGSIRH
jgi:sterol desaturase/sphingolipid hydroxylase (fatty acid hydroxylase superfamily)